MTESDNKVDCAIHGKADEAFVCQHLVEGRDLGFNMGYDPDKPYELHPDAWCDGCEAIRDREGEWNDVAMAAAGIRLVCAGCYRDIRHANWLQDGQVLDRLIVSGMDYLNEAQDTLMQTYRLGEHERWDWDQETNALVFSHDGKPVVHCDIDFVGSLSTRSDTWMWAWANRSFTDNIKAASAAVRDIGDEHWLEQLACAQWAADEADGWAMTAIMAQATGAIGAYRTPSSNGFVYMVVKSAHWVQ